jgi:DNA-binding FadR family transcriptional regulator
VRSERGSKRAARVAEQIVDDIIRSGWPVGEVLGSESELAGRYRVSRAVFREAVRLVEHQGAARTRRGPGGGLVVTQPTVDAVIDAVVLYLHRVDATLDEVFEARVVLEEIVTELAVDRLEEPDLRRLRLLADDEAAAGATDPRALHAALAAISGNAALELFVDVLNRVSMLYSRDWRALGKTSVAGDRARAHARIVDAVLAGDAGLARRRMRTHIRAEGEFLRQRRSTRQLLPDGVILGDGEGGKRAEGVARAIAQSILARDLPPGALFGAEAKLIASQGVSRAVFREAVRILEHHQVAAMRRGPGGGLLVAAPSAAAVTDVVAVYLASRRMELRDVMELRLGVELTLVELAVDRIDPGGAARLDEALTRDASATRSERVESVHGLHAAVAELAGNSVLALVALVMIRLSRLYQLERLAPKALRRVDEEVRRTHEGIASAMASGDREVAKHRMRRHLEALADLVDRSSGARPGVGLRSSGGRPEVPSAALGPARR